MLVFSLICCLLYCSQNVAADCVTDPTPSNCTDFQLPPSVVRNDLDSLCAILPLVGCTVDHICNTTDSQSQYCDEFSILKTICDNDMPQLGGCANYNSLCANGSSVSACNIPVLPLPSSVETTDHIRDMCGQMDMADCIKCTGDGECGGFSPSL